jgi:hypothetical protein
MKKIHFIYEDDDGNEVEAELPAKYEACDRCKGEGKHDNPAFSNGITSDEWNSPDWDDESKEAYLRGDYDVACEECNGKNVILVVDEDWIVKYGAPELKNLMEKYFDQKTQEAQWRAEEAHLRRMESYAAGERD